MPSRSGDVPLFLLFLTFGDDIIRPSYFFRAFSGRSSRNRVIPRDVNITCDRGFEIDRMLKEALT